MFLISNISFWFFFNDFVSLLALSIYKDTVYFISARILRIMSMNVLNPKS